MNLDTQILVVNPVLCGMLTDPLLWPNAHMLDTVNLALQQKNQTLALNSIVVQHQGLQVATVNAVQRLPLGNVVVVCIIGLLL